MFCYWNIFSIWGATASLHLSKWAWSNDTTDIRKPATCNYSDFHLNIDNGGRWKKQQTRWLPIVNFPLNIPAAPVFDVYISQLILYSSGYAQWSDFQWDQLPTQDLLKQAYVAIMLNSPLQTFHGCHHELAAHCELSIFQMPIDVFTST